MEHLNINLKISRLKEDNYKYENQRKQNNDSLMIGKTANFDPVVVLMKF